MQEGRLGVAMKDLSDAQAILDAKQAELDAVKVGIGGTITIISRSWQNWSVAQSHHL